MRRDDETLFGYADFHDVAETALRDERFGYAYAA
jgi:hypothetical protein